MDPSTRDLYTDTDDVPLSYSSGVDDDGSAEFSSNAVVNLAQQYLTHIPDNLFTGSGARYTLAQITELSLANNRFQELPDLVCKMASLVVLDLSNNNLTSLPVELELLSKLKALAVRNNMLSLLPKTLPRLVELEELNLAGNEFTEFPAVLLELHHMRSLYMGANQLTKLPEAIDQLTNLEILYLGGNRLQSVPEAIGKLGKLSALALCDNQLETLPCSFGDLRNLQTLSLHNNQIRYLPTEIVTLQNLANLSLRNNPLVSRFVNCVEISIPTLKELAARVIRTSMSEEAYAEMMPQCVLRYLRSAAMCVNPKCKGVYFEARAEHVKFTDFCGKFRVPLMQYLCSPRCTSTEPALAMTESETEDEQQPSSSRMQRVLLG